MDQIKLFIELTRLKKPIGYMLLFWPCAWGLTLAYDFSNNLNNYFFYLLLFFLGALLMRSAGCIVNDVLENFVSKVGQHIEIVRLEEFGNALFIDSELQVAEKDEKNTVVNLLIRPLIYLKIILVQQ